MEIDRTDINFQSHWEAQTATKGWMSKISCKEDLVKQEHVGPNNKYGKKKVLRLRTMYGKHELKGHGLECAFACGNSLYWISKLFPKTTFDAFDFNYALEKIIPFIKEEHGNRLKEIWIGNAMNIPKPENNYDWINCGDFFEHTPEEAYWKILKEVKRILKPGGLFGVYVGQAKLIQHIRVVPPEQTRKELESVGFKALSNYLFMKDYLK